MFLILQTSVEEWSHYIIVEDSQISGYVENPRTSLLELLVALDVEVLMISVCILNQLNIYLLESYIPFQYQI